MTARDGVARPLRVGAEGLACRASLLGGLTYSLESEIISVMKIKVLGETSWQTRVLVDKVVGIMERRRITRLELARRLGVRPSYVTKLLSGRENMTVKTMEKMAEAVGYRVVISLKRRPGAFEKGNEATLALES